MSDAAATADALPAALDPERVVAVEESADGVPTARIAAADAAAVLEGLKHHPERPYRTLYDLTAVDERERRRRAPGLPDSDLTLVYHLLEVERDEELRLKAALPLANATAPTVSTVWPAANWYEREVYDLFGVRFDGHPDLRRILLPPTWQGHPLRKDHPARATDMAPFELSDERQDAEQEALRFEPEAWGLEPAAGREHLFLNLGPQHPGTHGVLRIVLQLDGEEVVAVVPDIGYHHRGAEKMGERQSWHTFIPYTDRIDYLGGVMNNLPYVLAVERLAGIEVPERAAVIRVMLCELFRVISHLVWYGTFAQDLGAMSPVFYMFNDREAAFDVTSAICGDRMHPNWFRIGGVAQDLPDGWQEPLRHFLDRMEKHLPEYRRMVLDNSIFKHRTIGVGACTLDEALEWGMSGPMLRACGLAFDLRKARPYAGYDRFEFDVPTADTGDCYGRALVRHEEIRQSLRIVRQCLEAMPGGDWKARHHLATPPLKDHRTMHDIETLITHFLGVSWGPVIPPGEVHVAVEASKGWNGYWLTSDGDTAAYRVRIRTPSFAHMQTLSLLCRGHSVADVLAVLGSIDYVLADVDR